MIPTYLGRTFDQICFVVPDLAEAVDHWRRTAGVQRWSIAENLAKHQQDKEYWGESEDFQFSCAYGFAGDTLIELARHDGGRSVYADWHDSHGTAPHHVGYRLDSRESYAAACAHFEGLGLVKAMGGRFVADSGNCWWSYYDTTKSIGVFTELYYIDGTALEAFWQFRRGESDDFIPKG